MQLILIYSFLRLGGAVRSYGEDILLVPDEDTSQKGDIGFVEGSRYSLQVTRFEEGLLLLLGGLVG